MSLHSGDFELNIINLTERLERSRDNHALKFASKGIFECFDFSNAPCDMTRLAAGTEQMTCEIAKPCSFNPMRRPNCLHWAMGASAKAVAISKLPL